MSLPRRLRGDAKGYSDLCDDCDDAIKSFSKSTGGTAKSQGTNKTDSTTDYRSEDKENLSDDRRVLLAITVEIEDGCVEHIEMKEGDSAEAVAMRFCQEHALPEQFVAPLTEHIVSNIITISKEDSDIVLQSQEEQSSYEENSHSPVGGENDLRINGSDLSGTSSTFLKGGSSPVAEEPNALLARPESPNRDAPLMASQKVNRYQGSGSRGECKARKKAMRKTGAWKAFSDRLVSPTITSLAKCGALEKQKPRSPHLRPLSEQAKAVYMRLYTEYLRQERRSKEDLKRSIEAYEEKVVKDRVGLSKNSWRMTRMRGKIAKQYKNYGELLYAEGLTLRQNQLKAVSDKQKQDEAREMAELTLKPKISERAKTIKRGHGQVWNRLQNEDKPKQDQLQDLRQEVWEAKVMECTFKPQINPQRRFDGQEQYDDYYGNRFEQLFLDAESRRRRRAEYTQWYPEGVTFQPTINRSNTFMDCEFQQEDSVFRRLLENASRMMEKKQMQEHLSKCRQFDPHTGQELFKPMTGREPSNRNPVRLPVGEYLHKMKYAFDRKIRNLATREQKMKKEQSQCQYVGPNSQRLLRRLHERGFKEVFELLDEDKDGYVDLTTANFERLNQDLVEDIMRLIETGKGAEKKLNFDKFLKLMLAAEKNYHSGQHVHLVLKHKTHAGESNYTFQFKMDKISRSLAAKRRKYSTHREWFEIICAELARRHQKVEDMRKQKRQQEMAECTFRPGINCDRKALQVKSCDDGSGRGFVDAISSIVEKVQQEVHGFYFQGERGGPEWLGVPACASTCHAPGYSRSPDCPRCPSHFVGGKRVLSVAQREVEPRQDRLSVLDDLPKATDEAEKQGLFFGIMGA